MSITRAAEELSIVCPSARVPADVQAEPGWRAFMLKGPIPFSQTGVLSGLLAPLATAGVPIFAVSTFDTDYILVPEARVEDAVHAFHASGHDIT